MFMIYDHTKFNNKTYELQLPNGETYKIFVVFILLFYVKNKNYVDKNSLE